MDATLLIASVKTICQYVNANQIIKSDLDLDKKIDELNSKL